MQIKKSYCLIFLIALFSVLMGCGDTAPKGPTITLSVTHIPANGNTTLSGEGFSSKSDLESHLRRPNGTEFPVVAMLSDSDGKFTHEIETWLLLVGTHEVWVIDKKTGVTSNVATFEVTREQPPPPK